MTALYYLNADIVTSDIFAMVDIKRGKKQSKSIDVYEDKTVEIKENRDSDVVILDVSSVTFIDLMGVQALTLLMSEFERVDRQLVLTGVPETILPMLKSTDFLAKHGDKIFLNLEAVFTQVVNTTHDYLSE